MPRFPLKALVRSLIYGPVIGAVLYFGVHASLTNMWQLAPFLIAPPPVRLLRQQRQSRDQHHRRDRAGSQFSS